MLKTVALRSSCSPSNTNTYEVHFPDYETPPAGCAELVLLCSVPVKFDADVIKNLQATALDVLAKVNDLFWKSCL